jgi:hypothetical protein
VLRLVTYNSINQTGLYHIAPVSNAVSIPGIQYMRATPDRRINDWGQICAGTARVIAADAGAFCLQEVFTNVIDCSSISQAQYTL